jgi:hypothetical protein
MLTTKNKRFNMSWSWQTFWHGCILIAAAISPFGVFDTHIVWPVIAAIGVFGAYIAGQREMAKKEASHIEEKKKLNDEIKRLETEIKKHTEEVVEKYTDKQIRHQMIMENMKKNPPKKVSTPQQKAIKAH